MRPTALLLALFAAAGPAAQADDVDLRKEVMAWLKANSSDKVLDDGVVVSMTKPVAEFTSEGHNFTILLGSKMTKDGKPYMVCGWTGTFFPFPLTEAQARGLGLKPLGLETNANRRTGTRAGKPVAEVSALKVTDADALDGGKKVKGTLKMKVLRPAPAGADLRLRLELKFADRTAVKYIKASRLPTDAATIGFAFGEINPPGGTDKPLRGTVGAFFDLVQLTEDGGKTVVTVLSNTVGTLVDVE